MSQQLSPWLEGAYGWNFGEGGWNSGMDQNLIKFSFMFDRNVDSITAALPAAVDGQAHYLTTDNRLYFAVGTTYFSTVVPKWFTVVVRSTGATWQYNGTSVSQIDSPAELDARLDAVELTISTLGTAAFQNIEFFATQAALDVVSATASNYTDTLRSDIVDTTDTTKGSGQVGFNSLLTYPAGSAGSALTQAGRFKFPEQYASLDLWAASGGSLGILAGTYPVDTQLSFPFGTSITTFGDAVLDASAAIVLGNFPQNCAIRLGGGSFDLMADLSTDYGKGSNLITFSAPHNLVAGDIFVIYNPTDFSYSSFRDNYRAGEFCRVLVVASSTQVRLASPLFAGYTAAAVDVYKMTGGSFKVNGSLKVIAPEALPAVMGVRAQRLIDSDITGLKAFSKQSSSALELEKCFNITGSGLVLEQALLSGTGNDYGLVISNCQHIDVSGYFTSSRHGVTTGGYGDIGSVPCRDITVRGTASTTFEGVAHAVNTHGNTENFLFDGRIFGGFDGGGNHISVKGEVHAADDGVCFYHAEMTGYDRDYSGVRMYSNTNPATASRGVFDLGGNNTSSAAADTIGGTVDCSGSVVYAPLATSVFKIIQRNSIATDIRVKLDDAQIAQAAAGYESVRVTNSGGAAPALTSMRGFEAQGEAAQVHTSTELRGVEISGFVDIPVTTAMASANSVVNFPVGVFKDAPIVNVSTNTTFLGATKPIANTNSPSVSAVTLTVSTPAATNFGANGTVRVFWTAKTVR